VSRGGTAKLIRETLGVEVIEIGISQLDLLRVLKPHIGGKRPVAVAGFRTLTEKAQSLCSILDIPSIILPVDDESEMPERIERVKGMDLACFIGDMIALRSAEGIAAPLALIESGPDAVRVALEKAAIVSRSLMFRRESDLRLGVVLNTVRDAIVAVDRDGIMTHINRTARALLGPEALEGLPADTILPDRDIRRAMAERREAFGNLVEVGGRSAALDVTPIVSRDSVEGAVVVLQEIGKLQDTEKKVRRQLHAKGLFAKYQFDDIAARSPAMRECLDIARYYARSVGAILIYGETGAGKERLAQSIHNGSPVRDGPFVAINCGALPPTLLESELFGYEEGAFTGAGKGGKAGLFELAHGGTIFLDEINELDVQLQGKLLRVLQEREVMRVGGIKVIPVSFRLIAASNIPLKDEMERGRIRRDLFYRLDVLDIRIPPLRERVEDIEPLFRGFVDQCAARDGDTGPQPEPPEELLETLESHSWPGNVRELENVAEKWTVLRRLLPAADAARMAIESFAPQPLPERGPREERPMPVERQSHGPAERSGPEAPYSGSLEEIVVRAAKAVFEEEEQNLSRAARRLGIDRQTLKKKLEA
jgi:transcriptional regulator with PAS, ATPase and Fis domain